MILELICDFCWKGKRDKTCTRTCCLLDLYETKENPTKLDIINWCCIERCHHDKRYHESYCPISRSGINKIYPLNPKLK